MPPPASSRAAGQSTIASASAAAAPPQSQSNAVPASTKVCVRRCPPALPEDVFWSTVQSFDDGIDWKTYRQGRVSTRQDKENIDSVAYIHFKLAQDVTRFAQAYQGHVFRSKGGQQSQVVVQYAPFQKIPNKKQKPDPLAGTIDEDPDYLAFVTSLTEPEKPAPSETTSGLPKTRIKTTPLLEELRRNKAALLEKQAVRAEKSKLSKKEREKLKKEKERDKEVRKKEKEKEKGSRSARRAAAKAAKEKENGGGAPASASAGQGAGAATAARKSESGMGSQAIATTATERAGHPRQAQNVARGKVSEPQAAEGPGSAKGVKDKSGNSREKRDTSAGNAPPRPGTPQTRGARGPGTKGDAAAPPQKVTILAAPSRTQPLATSGSATSAAAGAASGPAAAGKASLPTSTSSPAPAPPVSVTAPAAGKTKPAAPSIGFDALVNQFASQMSTGGKKPQPQAQAQAGSTGKPDLAKEAASGRAAGGQARGGAGGAARGRGQQPARGGRGGAAAGRGQGFDTAQPVGSDSQPGAENASRGRGRGGRGASTRGRGGPAPSAGPP